MPNDVDIIEPRTSVLPFLECIGNNVWRNYTMFITLLGMIGYTLLSGFIVNLLTRNGNDLLKLVGIIILSLVAPFHTAYKMILFGFLLQSLGYDRSDIVNMSMLRRRYGYVFNVVGTLCTLLGIAYGIYALIFH